MVQDVVHFVFIGDLPGGLCEVGRDVGAEGGLGVDEVDGLADVEAARVVVVILEVEGGGDGARLGPGEVPFRDAV